MCGDIDFSASIIYSFVFPPRVRIRIEIVRYIR